MNEEISLGEQTEKRGMEGEQGLLRNLEGKVDDLLAKYHELKKERDELALSLDREKERLIGFEKQLELLSEDKEKVKKRIDQLLHRLKGVEM